MKNALTTIVVAVLIIFFSSCHKCFECQNMREVCSKVRYDTTLTIIISSQNLSQQYYTEYIDSLTSPSLGWVCHDTTSDVSEEFCEPRLGPESNSIYNEEAKGYTCKPK